MPGGFMKTIPAVSVEFIHQRNLEMYSKNFIPLMEKNKYDKAWEFLLKNPEVKDYVHASDWREMCEYFAIKLNGLGKIVSDSEDDGQC